jgi:hypothetical protein
MQFDAVAEWQYTSAGDPAAICCCSCSFKGTRILSRRYMLDQTGPCASNTANRVDAFNLRARNRSDFRAPTPSRRGPGKHSLCNSCYAEYFRPATGNTHTIQRKISSQTQWLPRRSLLGQCPKRDHELPSGNVRAQSAPPSTAYMARHSITSSARAIASETTIERHVP